MNDEEEPLFSDLSERNEYFKAFVNINRGLFGNYGRKLPITEVEPGQLDEGTRICSKSCDFSAPYGFYGISNNGCFVTFRTEKYRGKDDSNGVRKKKKKARDIAKKITKAFVQKNIKDYAVRVDKEDGDDWIEVADLNSDDFKKCKAWGIYSKEVKNKNKLESALINLIPLFCNYIAELSGGLIKNMPNQDEKDYGDDMIEKAKQLLLVKRNIILQGAPGTGKTYSTAALALAVIGMNDVDFKDHEAVMKKYNELLIKFDGNGNVKKNGQIGFVTFHQSMDYEDFIEGFKPKQENDNVVYGIEDGVFKGIVELAINNYEDSCKSEKELKIESDTKNLFEQFCLEIEKKLLEDDDVPLNSSSKMKIRGVNRRTDGTAKSISLSTTSSSTQQTLTLDIVLRDYPKYKNKEIKSPDDIKPKYESTYSSHGNASYYFELYKKMADFEKKVSISGETQSNKLKKYVLIIDEINRGNVSKIFGELISLLEADKRIGGNHPLTVTLPYSKEPFSVPSNLYIIGTMNTTDRSVGSIDYAVRRRFAFVTLEANEWLVPEGDARNLFNAVKNFLNKSKYDMDIEDLMVGHSYFMDSDNLQMKWQYEILPLLMEYHKDGIISKSPLKDKSGNEIEDVKKNYTAFTSAWQKKESEETEA